MAIRSGEMRHRLRFEKPSEVLDAAGQSTRTWTLVAERWGSVEPLVGREFFASVQRHGRVQTRFRIRYFDGIGPQMRIVVARLGKVYDITDVMVVNGLKNEVVIMADELVGEVP